jgi:hypothetical protein
MRQRTHLAMHDGREKSVHSRAGAGGGSVEMLAKAFNNEQLIKTVRRVLERYVHGAAG